MKKHLLMGILWISSTILAFTQTTAPVLTASTTATVDNPFVVGYVDDAAWEAAIDSILYNDIKLTAGTGYVVDIDANEITFDPSVDAVLQTAGTANLTIYVDTYTDATISQTIGHGVAANMVITTQPVGPTSNGGDLVTQPVLAVRDQYSNNCTTDDATQVTASESGGAWTLDGTRSVTALNGVVTFSGLKARSDAEITTATITFTSGSLSEVVTDAITIPAKASAPKLLASSTATVDNSFEVSFIDNAGWQLSIDSIIFAGNKLLEVAYNTSQSAKIIFDPAQDPNLQTATIGTLIVYARGYEDTQVSQEIKHGVAAEIEIVLQPTAPSENGGLLANQPVLKLVDQYSNDCTGENSIEITAAKEDANDWTLGGSLVKRAVNGSVSYNDLTASSLEAIAGAVISFSAPGIATINANSFNIPDLATPPVLTAALGATVDADFIISFTENTKWRTQITEIRYGADVLPVTAYDTTASGLITFKPSASGILQTATNKYIIINSTSFLKDSVEQEILHGIPAIAVITTQPQRPTNNGDLFETQPIVKVQDQYSNDCVGNNEQIVEASATGGSWILEGTASKKVTNGVVEYTNLTARSTDLVTDATITFSGTGLTSLESDPFIIPAPLIAPNLIASTSATVDSLFDVTFAENAEWQGSIDSVSFGGKLLAEIAYDKSQAGKLVFDPSQSTELQVASTKEMIVFARGYENSTVNQEIKHGAPDTLIINTQPEAPGVNGGSLATQPKISMHDKYKNKCTGNNTFEVKVAKGDSQDWILSGTTTQTLTAGGIKYSDLSASSASALTGVFLTFSGAEITSVNSDTFDIVALKDGPNINPAFQVTVDNNYTLNYFTLDDDWSSNIKVVTYGGDTLSTAGYTVKKDAVDFHISEDALLQKAGTFNIVFHSTGYKNITVEQEVGHGKITRMEITQQPLAPSSNGDVLEQQPVLQFLDQYSNLCNTEMDKTISAAKNDLGEWNLAGTVEVQAKGGIITFFDLSAYSAKPISGASIQFTSENLLAVVSDDFDIPDVTDAPLLNAASNATVDNPFVLTFTEDSVWRSRINVVTSNDRVLVESSYDTSKAGELKLIPSESAFLQKSGTFKIVVQSRGFANDTVLQDLQHGEADTLLIVQQPTSPRTNGELLEKQPELKLKDQYLNDCTGDNSSLVKVEKYDTKDWFLGGRLEIQSQGGKVVFTDLSATSEIAVDSAYLQFSFALDSVVSSLFTIPVPVIELTSAENVTVDNEFTIGASDNASWRDSISSITFAGQTLADTSYMIEAASITFYPDKDSNLSIARTDTIVVFANGYANASVEQTIGHGVAKKMQIVNQPIGPLQNGDTLAQQPKLKLIDQYSNNCTTDDVTQILASKYSDGSNTDVVDLWELGGTRTITAVDGVIEFTNLTATSENKVEGARLLFTSEGLSNVVSDSFTVVIPPSPVVSGAVNANVDEIFTVKFTENKAWRSLIHDIRYGIRSLEGNYDASIPGQITFDPSLTSILQKSGVDSIYIYSGNYDTVRFEQAIRHGKSKYIVIMKEPSAPVSNGEVFLRQPQLKLQDQYRNNCITDNETPVVVKKGDKGDWILGGTLTQIASEGTINYTDLTAKSDTEVEGARLEFEGTGLIPKLSQFFTIPEPVENRAGEARANPELVCYGDNSKITLLGFDGEIQWQKYIETTDSYEDIEGENSALFVVDKVVESARYRAMVVKEGLSVQYSNTVTVSPMNPPVADFTFEIDYNRVDFTNLSTNATSILWDFGDGVLSSQYDPSHSFVLGNVDGTGYTVTLTASNDACPDSRKEQQIFITTGIKDLIAESGLVVYPNPNRGEFFVEIANSDKEGLLRIFNQAGKLVVSRTIKDQLQNNRIAFDLRSLSGGVYLLSIQYPDKIIRAKLIIQ